MSLKNKYEKIANDYIEEFVKKQGYKFDYWVGNNIGGIASFIEQYYFSFDDIRKDIDGNVEPGLILKWQDDYVESHCNNTHFLSHKTISRLKISNISYESYIMGARFKKIE